ncbi:S41 family peptidase [Vibrio scophthalmi]|uniref:S41 family peptidase n=1 Tax=Vibrio scophthalmi TaxID=45658 RepID=UPI0038736E95
MRKIFGLTLLSTLSLAFSHTISAQVACQHEFRELTRLVEENYAGYADVAREEVELAQEKTRERIQYNPAIDCFAELSNWLTIFSDPHLEILPIESAEQHRDKRIAMTETKSAQASIDWLSSNVAHIRLPRFDDPARQNLSEFIHRNRQQLHAAEGMIIDVRGNQGESFIAMRQWLPLIGTEEYFSRWHVLASSANKAHYQRRLEQLDSAQLPEVTAMYTTLLNQMDAYPNTWIEYLWPTVNSDLILPHLHTIYLLIDDEVANAAEEFVIAARSNSHVTVMGINTQGALDYGEAVTYTIGVGDGYQVLIPSQKRVWYQYGPIDNSGLAPDVFVRMEGKSLVSHAYLTLKRSMMP